MMHIKINYELLFLPSRFNPVDLDGEVSDSSPGHTKDFINGTYCSSACAGHNGLE
jgi:hypothetical protein